jgi:HSP20 family molecular chaperone IbpA
MVGGEEVRSDEVFDELKGTYQTIARRAYELHESRTQELREGRTHEEGHGISDWLRAELELLLPVRVVIEESPRQLTVRALVVSFGDDEVLVHVEPQRIIIHSAESEAREPSDGASGEPDAPRYKLLHVVELPTPVDPESARVMLDDGLLEVQLWKNLVF